MAGFFRERFGGLRAFINLSEVGMGHALEKDIETNAAFFLGQKSTHSPKVNFFLLGFRGS